MRHRRLAVATALVAASLASSMPAAASGGSSARPLVVRAHGGKTGVDPTFPAIARLIGASGRHTTGGKAGIDPGGR
jgi:hypothetical protein